MFQFFTIYHQAEELKDFFTNWCYIWNDVARYGIPYNISQTNSVKPYGIP
jgi:hypothetical protein